MGSSIANHPRGFVTRLAEGHDFGTGRGCDGFQLCTWGCQRVLYGGKYLARTSWPIGAKLLTMRLCWTTKQYRSWCDFCVLAFARYQQPPLRVLSRQDEAFVVGTPERLEAQGHTPHVTPIVLGRRTTNLVKMGRTRQSPTTIQRQVIARALVAGGKVMRTMLQSRFLIPGKCTSVSLPRCVVVACDTPKLPCS